MVTDDGKGSRLISAIRRAGTAPASRLAFAVLMWLAAAQADAPARPPQAAPLDLQITQVTRLAQANPQAATDVEVRWTARVPQATTLDGFDVLLEVRYSDGARASARGDALKATARSVTLQVASHPKANPAAALKTFHVSLRARFKNSLSASGSQTVVRDGSF
ncbi:MAG TPA: hypothetical protein VJ464_15060 [Blastocatellia bacterium]|nr:hypothetical protein [Blastocatellia bacterium]